MTDKEKIKFWTKGRLFEIMNGIGENDAKNILTDLLSFIDSLEKEPINTSIDFEQELYKNFGQVKDFTLAVKIAKKFYEMGKLSNVESNVKNWKEEPVSEDLEDAAKNHAVERYKATRDMVLAEKCKWSFKAGAEWNFERIKEALLSKVLPYFMNGGEADEVVAKLDEVLNQK